MKKKWLILFTLIIVGGVFFLQWQKESKLKVMGSILDSIPVIDSIIVKDGKTKEDILTFTNSDTSFSEIVDIYRFYYDLKWTERKLLKGEPFMEVEFLQGNEIEFTVSIYQIEEKHISMLPEAFEVKDGMMRYSYSPEGSQATYIFAIEEINQLIGAHENLKKLFDTIITNEKVPSNEI